MVGLAAGRYQSTPSSVSRLSLLCETVKTVREKKEPSPSRRSITLPGKRMVSMCIAATPYREKRPEACLPLACVGFLYENVFPLVERDANRMARMARGLLARLSFLLILQLCCARSCSSGALAPISRVAV